MEVNVYDANDGQPLDERVRQNHLSLANYKLAMEEAEVKYMNYGSSDEKIVQNLQPDYYY